MGLERREFLMMKERGCALFFHGQGKKTRRLIVD